MSDTDNGGPAFPAAYTVGPNDDLYPPEPGMSLRDWFAGQAAAALMVSCIETVDLPTAGVAAAAAKAAYILADALLEARTNPSPETQKAA